MKQKHVVTFGFDESEDNKSILKYYLIDLIQSYNMTSLILTGASYCRIFCWISASLPVSQIFSTGFHVCFWQQKLVLFTLPSSVQYTLCSQVQDLRTRNQDSNLSDAFCTLFLQERYSAKPVFHNAPSDLCAQNTPYSWQLIKW